MQTIRRSLSFLAAWLHSVHRRFGDQLARPEQASNLALLQALVIGLIAGVTTVLFRWTMGLIGTWRNAVGLDPHHWWEWTILPLIGLTCGAIAGHLTVKGAQEAKGSGIPQVKYALAHPTAPMRRRTILVKFWGAAIAIGGGLSLGREGPTVQIGAGIGEWVSRWFPYTKHERRRLMAAGAGAGLAAAFNTPIAGFVFVVEELLRNFSTQTMGVAILAPVTAAVVARSLAGNYFSYQTPITAFHLTDLPAYVALGVLAGLAGVGFIRGILRSLDLYERIKWLPRAWHPALAGLITGIAGLFLPRAIGGAHDLAEDAFHGLIALEAIPVLFLAKYMLTVLAYGSGVPGGVFAPTLVLGAVLGAGVGELSALWTHGDLSAVAGFAYVGMGALFTAVARAPVTAVIIVFELTGNYTQILPLMLACLVAHLTAHALKGVSIYDALLIREGTPLPESHVQERLGEVTVDQVMSPTVEWVEADAPLAELRARFLASGHGGFPVLEDGRLVGIVTRRDLAEASDAGREGSIREIMTPNPIAVRSDATLEFAWQLLTEHAIGRLVVTFPSQPDRVLGILTRSDLLRGTLPRRKPPSAAVAKRADS